MMTSLFFHGEKTMMSSCALDRGGGGGGGGGFTVCTLWAGLVQLPVVVLAITE